MPGSTAPFVIGVSACLVGETVRYDGGHKFHALIADHLTLHARLAPFCPELKAGLGVPRPPVRLIASSTDTRALGVEEPDLDVTDALSKVADDYCDLVEELGLVGFIFKSRSPSCGRGSTPVHGQAGDRVIAYADGLFAERLRIRAPWLACVEEDWLRSESHCWRYLTACALVAERRHGTSGRAEFLREVEEHSRLAGEDLVTILLEGGDDAGELGELLEQYWRR